MKKPTVYTVYTPDLVANRSCTTQDPLITSSKTCVMMPIDLRAISKGLGTQGIGNGIGNLL